MPSLRKETPVKAFRIVLFLALSAVGGTVTGLGYRYTYGMSAKATLPAPLPTPLSTPLPASTPHPRFILTGMVGATPLESVRLQDAMTYANQRLAESCFRTRVLDDQVYTENRGMTQSAIYTLIGREPVKLTVELFDGSWLENHAWGTVAYEGTGDQIKLNRAKLGSAKSIAATYVHEGLGHHLGFQHAGAKATSVPYGLQHAMETCP